jgi:Zn finger protein HypA/HybF involved in hydrogenase expression
LWCYSCIEKDPTGYREVARQSAAASIRKFHAKREQKILKLAAKKRRLRAARPRQTCPNCGVEQSQVEFYSPRRGGELRVWCRLCVEADPPAYRRELNARRHGLRRCPNCQRDKPPMDFGGRGQSVRLWCRDCARADPEGYAREQAARARICRHRRRARILALPFEHVTLEQLGRRDGWLCGRCHKPVDRKLRWPHRWSASIGHIRRVVDGRPYIITNLRLEHLTCNVRNNHDRTAALLALSEVTLEPSESSYPLT